MTPPNPPKPVAPEPLALPLALIAGWVLPGLGHALTGHARRGAIAGSACLLLFFAGLLIGGIDAVDWKNDRLWFAGQVLIGPVALVTAYTHEKLDKHPPLPPSPGYSPAYQKSIGRANELGTLYCALAGVLNLLVLLDLVGRTDPEPDSAEAGGDSSPPDAAPDRKGAP